MFTLLIQIGKIGVKNSGQQDLLSFVYIPSHLYHILFELFKNAMRASIDQAGEDALYLPPIEGNAGVKSILKNKYCGRVMDTPSGRVQHTLNMLQIQS